MSQNVVMPNLEKVLFRACLMEVSARKLGNVHWGAEFEQTNANDFVRSAKAIAPILSQCTPSTIGETILKSVRATQNVVGQNTNLGIILLLAPLVAIPIDQAIDKQNLEAVLDALTVQDSQYVFEAIRIASPAGLGTASQEDIRSIPTQALRAVMKLAAKQDSIARQYDNCYADILPRSTAEWNSFQQDLITDWEGTVIQWQLELMSQLPDTLIRRKCGEEIANLSAQKAAEILEQKKMDNKKSNDEKMKEFDQWLRSDGNRRNPGTTADLIAARLFLILRKFRVSSAFQKFYEGALQRRE